MISCVTGGRKQCTRLGNLEKSYDLICKENEYRKYLTQITKSETTTLKLS